MPYVAVPLKSSVDPTVGDGVSSAVADQQRYLDRIKASQRRMIEAIQSMSGATSKIQPPSVKLDRDIKDAYDAGVISFEHSCFVQLVRNTSKEQPDEREENPRGEPIDDAAGHAGGDGGQPQASETGRGDTEQYREANQYGTT